VKRAADDREAARRQLVDMTLDLSRGDRGNESIHGVSLLYAARLAGMLGSPVARIPPAKKASRCVCIDQDAHRGEPLTLHLAKWSERAAVPSEIHDLAQPSQLRDGAVLGNAVGQRVVDERQHQRIARLASLCSAQAPVEAEPRDLQDVWSRGNRAIAQFAEQAGQNALSRGRKQAR
jgi:hypothetical protein